MAADTTQSWFERNPKTSVVLVNLGVLFGLLLAAEIFLRVYIPYNPGYYMRIETNDGELRYPWGTVPVNSAGFPDEEFVPGDKPRVGYFGDSVNFGVGAGYGSRVSEYLERAYPGYSHWNFGGVGDGILEEEVQTNLKLAREHGLSKAILLFNLNDIMADFRRSEKPQGGGVRIARDFVRRNLDWLRGRSYVYSLVRTTIKNFLVVRGMEATGFYAVERFPEESREILEQTATRLNKMAVLFGEAGVELLVVLLPYEMQVSNEAAEAYAELKIDWEDGFLEGSTQRMMREFVDDGVVMYDAYYAFVDPAAAAQSKARNGLGQYYVFDKGDKLDWNHPNAEGHELIARFLVEAGIL